MTNEQISHELLMEIYEIVQTGKNVTFEQDMGEGTMTIIVGDRHNHIGWPDASKEECIKNLHDLMINGKGLTWA